MRFLGPLPIELDFLVSLYGGLNSVKMTPRQYMEISVDQCLDDMDLPWEISQVVKGAWQATNITGKEKVVQLTENSDGT